MRFTAFYSSLEKKNEENVENLRFSSQIVALDSEKWCNIKQKLIFHHNSSFSYPNWAGLYFHHMLFSIYEEKCDEDRLRREQFWTDKPCPTYL